MTLKIYIVAVVPDRIWKFGANARREVPEKIFLSCLSTFWLYVYVLVSAFVIPKSVNLNDRDIFVRMLYKDSYWFLLTFTFYFIFCYVIHRPKFHLFYHFTLDCIRWTCQLIIKRIPVRIVCGQYIYFGQFLVCPTVPPRAKPFVKVGVLVSLWFPMPCVSGATASRYF